MVLVAPNARAPAEGLTSDVLDPKRGRVPEVALRLCVVLDRDFVGVQALALKHRNVLKCRGKRVTVRISADLFHVSRLDRIRLILQRRHQELCLLVSHCVIKSAICVLELVVAHS